jgi:hypothetical protein
MPGVVPSRRKRPSPALHRTARDRGVTSSTSQPDPRPLGSWRTFYSTQASDGRLLLADAGFVYWIERRQTIKRMAKDGGGEPALLGESPVPMSSGGQVRVQSSGTELIIFGGYEAAVRLPLAGGKVITLVPDQPREVAAAGADDRHIYWITTEGVVSRVIR